MSRFPLASLFAFVTLVMGFSPQVQAGEPVAIVEEAPERTGVFLMDYLEAGTAFELASDEKLVISYLKSCQRETITGGRVIVGFEKSTVKGGALQREEIDCSGRGMKLSSGQAQESGVTAYRETDKFAAFAASYGTQPLFAPIENGPAIIQRVDSFEPPKDVEASGARLDLQALGISLTPGAIYRLRGPKVDFLFAIAPTAKAGPVPLIARLIRP
ncbi:hypothetical protein [Taklimakanibacter albus]|uniref:Uncharacterized protein n=1 Tax=Taklimakanibacter albus TaxID=2800327 RepID=A0ACC5R6V7_9HYPH|nr:hypothetical protein [Aestuariivirga sp. YIM B02566]MBK1868399.1 hypothetical protein [Aestuariivirga sp. YIM B02566]